MADYDKLPLFEELKAKANRSEQSEFFVGQPRWCACAELYGAGPPE